MNKQRSIRTWVMGLSLAFLLLSATTSRAEVTSYLLEVTYGLAHTTGGFSGGGMGDVGIEGRFQLNIDADSKYVDLVKVSLDFTELTGGGFEWDSLEGTISGTEIYVSSPNPISTLDNYLEGTFDGSTAYLEGWLSQPVYDGYNFNCFIDAVVILPGDYNGDGTVDIADYTVWADSFGQTGVDLPADGNGDGMIDIADYTVWADHFGETLD